MEVTTKICTKCEVEKPFSEFRKHPLGTNGLQAKCRNCEREYARNYNNTHKEQRKLYAVKYKKENKEKINKAHNEYCKTIRGKRRAKGAKRHARELRATPPWLTKAHLKQIDNIYTESSRLTKETGIQHHVDHIVPLQGKNVRGLHVPWNLQILTAEENIRKKNKF